MKYWRTRKYREKALALMVALAMVLSLFPGPGGVALATEIAVVEAGSATVAHDAAGADRTVDIPVDITVNPGLCSYTLEIGYNGSALTLNSITQGTAVVGSFLSNISFGPGKARATSTRATNDTGVGSLFTLNFTVADSAAAGDYPITAGVANDDPENFCTVNEEEKDPLKQVAALPVTFIPGKITVTAPPAAAQAPVFETDLSAGPVTYSAGGTAVALTVEASVTDGGEITYQWYSNSVNSTEGGSGISGATEASYTPSTAGIGTTYYYVIATNTLEGGAASATSAVATVTVNAPQSTTWDGGIDTSWYNTAGTYFELSSGAQLAGFAQIVSGTADGIAADSFDGKTVKLTADIDLGNLPWTTIGLFSSNPFAGTFDGNGKKINNLNIASTSANYTGALFSYNTGVVANLTIESGSVTANHNYAGAFIARNAGALVNCLNKAGVTSTNTFVGGLVGYNANGAFVIGYANLGSVTSSSTGSSVNLGGIAGNG